MVLNCGGLCTLSCIHNTYCDVNHEHPVLYRTCGEHVLDISEVACRTNVRYKHVHTISYVFVPKFILGIIIPRYTFHIIHFPIMIRLPIWVSRKAIPVPTLLIWRPPYSRVTEVGEENSLYPLDSPVAGKTQYFTVPETWVSP